MPRKKSVKRSAAAFKKQANDIIEYLKAAKGELSAKHVSWAYEYGILRLYREFEAMMLDALVGAINNDTSFIARSTGVAFPKHLTDEVCRYLIVGTGYFDFKGSDGLIQTLKKYVPDNHYLIRAMKKDKYKRVLDRLPALRNLAAHNSAVAKKRAKKAVEQHRMSGAGSWLKTRDRLEEMIKLLKELADDIGDGAPY
jgi:hypothetical protein